MYGVHGTLPESPREGMVQSGRMVKRELALNKPKCTRGECKEFFEVEVAWDCGTKE